MLREIGHLRQPKPNDPDRFWLIARARASHVRATRTRPVQFPAPPGLRSGARASERRLLHRASLQPAAFAALLRPRERKKGANSRTPAVFNYPRALPQGHCRFGPALAGSMVGRHRDLEILGASHVLDDALAVVGPPVDAEREVILRHRRALSRLGFDSTFSTSFGSTSKTELLTEASALGGPPPG